MKRLFALLLCLLLTATLLVSCGDADSTEKLIEKAFNKTNSLNAYEFDMNISLDVFSDDLIGGILAQTTIGMKVSACDIKSEAPKVSMLISMEMAGDTYSVDAYIEEDWLYMSVEGEGY